MATAFFSRAASVRPLLILCAVVLGAFALPGRALAAATERWYVIEIEGQRAGYMVVSEEPDGDNIRSRSLINIKMKRGPAVIPISMESVWVETAAGEPISMVSTTHISQFPIVKRYDFKGDKVELRVGKQKKAKELPRPPGDWKPPAASGRFTAQRLAAGDKMFVTRTLEEDPISGLKVMTTTRTYLEQITLDVVGKSVPATKWKLIVDAYPGVESHEFIDEHGDALRGESDMGGIRMIQILADKQLALSPVDPPELLDSTLVHPDRPIADPRRLREATYLLSLGEKKMPELPESAVQQVELADGGAVRVHVRSKVADDAPPPKVRGDDPAFLASSSMLKTDDPAVGRLVKNALPEDVTDENVRAEKLRRYVHKFIKAKEMSVGFASASEVAKTKTGDCTEHGVLLAALLRVAHIPSRVVSGLIYVDHFGGKDGIFGYHMWAQAWLPTGPDGKGPYQWVDLDATLPEPFDAAHITLGTSALGDNETENFMVTLAPLLKRLKIKVESTEP